MMSVITVVTSNPADEASINLSMEEIVELLVESLRADEMDFRRLCRLLVTDTSSVTDSEIDHIRALNKQWLSDLSIAAPYIREPYLLLYAVDVRFNHTRLVFEFVDQYDE